MFIYDEDHPESALLVSQVSHAWMAWQLAEHWGNRSFARPSPRPEVLAAILLHDAGWTEFDGSPGIDADGRPLTFDRMPPAEHIPIWERSIERAAAHSRYCGLLVSAHFSGMARRKEAGHDANGDAEGGRVAARFRERCSHREASWRAELADDARYAPALEDPGWRVNRSLLAACDGVSVRLCASLGDPFTLEVPGPGGGPQQVEVRPDGERRWRMRPWPLQGDRVRLQCEGRRPGRLRFASDDELAQALEAAPTVRLTFTLLRPSAR